MKNPKSKSTGEIHYSEGHKTESAGRAARAGAWMIIPAALAVAGPAFAQIDEIMVTAQKRESTLQTVPFSISAITGDLIEQMRIEDYGDVALRTPGVSFIQASKNQTFVSIRGSSIGDDAPGVDQGVAVFIDDIITMGTADLSPDLFDLERIEILRGPQGTLFGRNVTGGAILVVTKEPSFEPEVKVSGTYGNEGLLDVKGYVTGPLVEDRVAAKLSISSTNHDGFYTSVPLREDIGDVDSTSARAQFLLTPNDAVSIKLGIDYTRDRSDGSVTGIVSDFQPSLFPALSYDPDDVNHAFVGFADRDIFGFSGRVDWDLAAGTLTSISGFRHLDSVSFNSTTGDPFDQLRVRESEQDRQFTQEIRFASPIEDRLSWTIGAYYLDASKQRGELIPIDLLPGTALFTTFGGFVTQAFAASRQDIDIRSVAGFGDVSFDITETLNLSAGGRFTWEEKEGMSSKEPANFFIGPGAAAEYSESWSAFTPKVTITFEPLDEFFSYATVSRGFKGGGFSLAAATDAGLATPFDPEFVWNYEVGFKSRLLENRVQINASAFWMKYSDLQIRTFDAATVAFITQNAGESRVRGVELEINTRFVDWLDIGGTYGFQDSEFLVFDALGTGGVPIDNSGNELTNTPRHSVHVYAATNWLLPNDAGSISLRGDFTYKSKVFFTDENLDPSFVRDRSDHDGIVNARAAWTSANETWELSVWGKNITDKRVLNSAASLAPFYLTIPEVIAGNDVFLTHYNDPATYGATLTYRMN